MFCLYTSSKLSRLQFEFSLKVRVMRWNSGYLLKSFLFYLKLFILLLRQHNLWRLSEMKYHKYSPPSIRSYFSFKTLIQLLHYAGSSELVFLVEFKEYEGKKLLLFSEPLHFCGIFACLSLKCSVNCIVGWYICTDTVNAF